MRIKTQIQVRRSTWSLVKAYATSRSLTINRAVDILLTKGLASVGYTILSQKLEEEGGAAGEAVRLNEEDRQ